MVPDGNPEPVTLMSVEPTWPTGGEVVALRMTTAGVTSKYWLTGVAAA
jgi:hypothetical protein